MSMLQSSEAVDIQHLHQRLINPKLMQHHAQRERNLRISYSLHIHLDIINLIQTFSSLLKQEIEHEHLAYIHPLLKKEVIIGNTQHHSADYRLSIDGENLGTLTLSRNTRFNPQEINNIEEILCCLVYPLRNSLVYHQALNNSNIDPLTGVTNRSSLAQTLHTEWDLCHRHQHDLSLMIIDIDHYKAINDQYGHLCGDLILAEVAEQITSCIRDCDIIYRYGGDEFLVLLRETNTKGAEILAERIRSQINNHQYQYKAHSMNISVSIGLAWNQQQAFKNEIEFLEQTDKALYRAKHNGRNIISQ